MQPVKSTRFFPVLTTTKLTECRDFYTHYFGFSVVFEADWYIHLASATGIQLGFLQPHHPTQPDFLQAAYGGGGLIYSFEVDNVDEEYEKLKTSDLLMLLHVKTEEWGQRHFMIKDPSGMVIDVVQHTEPTDAYKDQYAG